MSKSNKPSVYLAGPITGLDYDGVIDWREHVRISLKLVGIETYSPMRGRESLNDVKKFSPMGEPDTGHLSTVQAITMRDHWDCKTRDLIFINMLGATKVSIGTVMEAAWGWAYRKPIVLIMERDGSNPHEHGMFNEVTRAMRFATLVEGIAATKVILLP
ncbi:hypothetical protein LCGC14_0472100 [marine sediment metagenome]|uniref:Nucleoside 2-deoxyribosyltransferase n=1 Tax=marine sediment metagenome TaxID=412755 RepID=A0A0F9VKT0_9ZZZZ